MKTSSSFQAGLRGSLLLLAVVVPLATASAEEKKRPVRKAQDRPALASKVGNFFFGASRQLERSMDSNDRSGSRSVKYTKPVANTNNGTMTSTIATTTTLAASSSAAGLPGKVTLTPRSNASTVIYVAPERTPLNGSTFYLNEDPTTEELLQPSLNPTVQPTVPAPTPTVAPKPQPPLDRSKLPTAQRGDTMSRVVSPYPPHNQLDVTGLPSGSLARDPSVGKIFIIP